MNVHETVRAVLTRELRALRRQIESYDSEADLWQTPPGITNSSGTLTLHLNGNLLTFIGAILGNTGYVRDRDAEFSRRNVPRSELLSDIDSTIRVVDQTLAELDSRVLSEPYPLDFGGTRVSTADFLVHLATHLAFHVGQIDYHRRLVTGVNRSIAPLAIAELASASPSE